MLLLFTVLIDLAYGISFGLTLCLYELLEAELYNLVFVLVFGFHLILEFDNIVFYRAIKILKNVWILLEVPHSLVVLALFKHINEHVLSLFDFSVN